MTKTNELTLALQALLQEAAGNPDTSALSDDDLAETSDLLDRAFRLTRTLRRETLDTLVDRAHGKSMSTDRFDVTIVPGAIERKDWRHVDLIKKLAKDVVPNQPKAAEKLAAAVAECARIDYWRKTDLSHHGVDADDFCEETRGNPTVAITHREDDSGAV